MSKMLRELLEIEFAALRVEFEHALLIKQKFKAENIIIALNQLLPTPLDITLEKLKSMNKQPKSKEAND